MNTNGRQWLFGVDVVLQTCLASHLHPTCLSILFWGYAQRTAKIPSN